MEKQIKMPSQSVKKVSLTKSFADAINLPRHGVGDDNYPLYPHADGSKVLMQRTPQWFKVASGTYNSPSNVRTVCLSGDGANVFYWAPLVKSGGVTRQVDAASDYVFDKTAKSGVKQYINPQLYAWDNSGLQALVNPVVLSNIEELWLSVDIFACPQYAQYYNLLSRLQPGQVSGAEFLKSILENEISTPSKPRTIADTFPLLRAIVVVQTPQNVKDFHKCAERTEEVKKVLEAKYPNQRRTIGETPELMQHLAKLTGFGFAVCPIQTGDILKFSLGDYKYDQVLLSGYKDKLFAKYAPKAEVPVVDVKKAESVDVKDISDTEWELAVGSALSELLKFSTSGEGALPYQDTTGYGFTRFMECVSLGSRDVDIYYGRQYTKEPSKGVFQVKYTGETTGAQMRSSSYSSADSKAFAQVMAKFINDAVVAFDTADGYTPQAGGESLADVIRAMEAECDNLTVIKQALFAHKQANPAFFKQQIPLLPKELREKYAAVFQ